MILSSMFVALRSDRLHLLTYLIIFPSTPSPLPHTHAHALVICVSSLRCMLCALYVHMMSSQAFQPSISHNAVLIRALANIRKNDRNAHSSIFWILLSPVNSITTVLVHNEELKDVFIFKRAIELFWKALQYYDYNSNKYLYKDYSIDFIDIYLYDIKT